MKLAATGHLVVTTTHAGTLSETFTRIFKATESTDESRRAIVASTLLGVVHLKSVTFEDKEGVFPTMWRRTTQSLADLISDGVASIIPDGQDVLGRLTMAHKVFNRQQDAAYRQLVEASFLNPDLSSALKEKIFAWASEDDVFEL